MTQITAEEKARADRERMKSDVELEEVIRRMDKVSNNFYGNAVQVGNHAYIEFCGLMGEYEKICRTTMQAGVDFTICNRHIGVPLIAHDYQIRYLAEKFECIFGPLFENKENRQIFFKAMGWEEGESKDKEKDDDNGMENTGNAISGSH